MGLYQVGDRVIVRNDLNQIERYYMSGSREVSDIATRDMVALRGQVVMISEICPNGKYLVRELGRRVWADEMIEGLYIGDITALDDLI